MNSLLVRDLMTPLEQISTIVESASLADAIIALETVNKNPLHGGSNQRVVVVVDQQGAVIGTITPFSIVRGIESGYDKIISLDAGNVAHEVDYVINKMKQQVSLWAIPLADICASTKGVKVSNFANRPSEDQTINVDDTLEVALQRFVNARYTTLFVVDKEKTVGLLLFSNVFGAIANGVKACTI
jgi:predicted transcriptional regulator